MCDIFIKSTAPYWLKSCFSVLALSLEMFLSLGQRKRWFKVNIIRKYRRFQCGEGGDERDN